VEFAQVIAGPLAGTLMADLGADVVHVEQPKSGDDARRMGPRKDGHGLWWKVLGRNKRSVTLDLRQEAAGPIVSRLLVWADVVIVTFRAATAERFGLDWPSVQASNPSAILLQITGYGATSSRKDEPGFGKMGEARSGAVHLTGFSDGPPIHTGFSQADSLTGLMGAFAVTAALRRRDSDPERRGEWIDLALNDTLFRLIEWQVILYDQLGTVPNRAGNSLAVAPGAVINTYRSADGDWITVTSATPKSVSNVARLLDLPPEDYVTSEQQEARKQQLDDALSTWISNQSTESALKGMVAADVVAAKVYDISDIFADDIYRERESIVVVPDADIGPIRMQDVVPRLKVNPGTVWRAGAPLGADTDHVLTGWLGVSPERIEQLRAEGIV
jgi:formyl-CoA transferase